MLLSKLKLGIISFAGAIGCLIWSPEAHATVITGYACSVGYTPDNEGGTYGSVFFDVYSGPDCTGSFQGYRYACSPSGLSPCTASVGPYTYRERALMSLWQNLVMASIQGVPLIVDSSGSKVSIVYFNEI